MRHHARYRAHMRVGIIFLAIGALAAALLATLWPTDSDFSVSAATERIELLTTADRETVWHLRSALLGTQGSAAKRMFAGTITIGSGASVSVERISGGPIHIWFSPDRQSTSNIGKLAPDDGGSIEPLTADTYVEIDGIGARAASGEHVVLPFWGDVRIGADSAMVSQVSTGIVRGGEVLAIGHSVLGTELEQMAMAMLEEGDVITLDDPSTPAIGSILADERPALNVVLHVKARDIEVSSPPARGYTVAISPFDRIKSDGVIQAIWATFVFLLGLRKVLE